MQNTANFLFSMNRACSLLSRKLSMHGLDFKDFMILHYLHDAPEKRLKRIELAGVMGLTASGITRILLPMEKIGLVARDQKINDDARTRYTAITNAGEETLQDARATLEMNMEEIFQYFDTEEIKKVNFFLADLIDALSEEEYASEAKMSWGNTEAYRQSAAKMKKMSKKEIAKLKADGKALAQKIADAMGRGPSDKEVQRLIGQHYKRIQFFYDCPIEIYRNLGNMYPADPRFRAHYETFAPGLADFMSKAINIFCDKKK